MLPGRSLPVPILLALILGLTALFGCGGGNGGDPAGSDGKLVIGGSDASETASSLYQMPTPNELFELVRYMAGEGHKRLLNPADRADRYVSRTSKAVNFGIYSTDLIYASYFKLNVEVARYYLTTKKLAQQLGLSAAFTDEDMIRLEANVTRGDSLEVISNEAYFRAYEKLQDEEMGAVLALVLSGGWIESMHLIMRQVEAFGMSEDLIARVAEQKVTLEHLVDLMEPHASDPDVDDLRRELLLIRDIYDRVNVQRRPHEGPSPSGRMVLGDDVEISMTMEQYRELDAAVTRLRDKVTRPDDEKPA
jgi:hypothetical protein